MYDLTPSEFNNYLEGELFREELILDKVRYLMAGLHNFSGFAKENKKPEEFMKLKLDDMRKKYSSNITPPTKEQLLKWEQIPRGSK